MPASKPDAPEFAKLIAAFRRARRGSPQRGKLIVEYAQMTGLSPRSAWRRLYHMTLDSTGNLVREPRKDKGKPRAGHYPLEKVPQIKKLLRNKELTLAAIARHAKAPYLFVRHIAAGGFDGAKLPVPKIT